MAGRITGYLSQQSVGYTKIEWASPGVKLQYKKHIDRLLTIIKQDLFQRDTDIKK